MSPRRINIIGGGLAGLSLGVALRRAGVPVSITEAGAYPRHRVCGEFIAGLRDKTIETLGLGVFLSDSRRHRTVTWYRGSRLLRQQLLPQPAYAISRYTLDARLAQAFQEAGGVLNLNSRAESPVEAEGTVITTGRRRAESKWLGLKAHVLGLQLQSNLEIHLGDHAYIGLCAVDRGAVNVCGLFKRRAGLHVTRLTALCSYARDCGLGELAARIEAAKLEPDSCCAVAGITLGESDVSDDRLLLGDAWAMIPPFTGNGMSMAFEAAAIALQPLVKWFHEYHDWDETLAQISAARNRRFRRRLSLASALHPFLLAPARQRVFELASRTHLLPLRTFAAAVHA